MTLDLGSRRPFMRRALGVALVSLVLGACSSGSAKPVGAPSTVATTSTTTQAQLEAVILGQWRAALEANVAAAKDPGGTTVDLLADYFVNPQLSFLLTQYAARARNGLTDIGSLDLGDPHIVSMAATQAIVETCETNSSQLVYQATGKPIAGGGPNSGVKVMIRTTLVVTPSGVWKVSDTTGTGSCVDS